MGDKRTKWNGYIYFAALSATLITFATGACFSWTSPIIPKLETSDSTINPTGKPVTTLESAMIVSMMSLGLIFGPPISILCTKFFSKKTTLLLVGFPLVAAHITCIFATNVKYFFAARFLMGLSSGSIWTVLPNFIAEISEDRNRGFLGSLLGVMSALGSLLTYLLGPFVPIFIFSIVNLIPLLFYYLLFGMFVPHSPYDLILKNKDKKAEQSLIKLRRNSKVQKELEYITNFIKSTSNDKKIIDLFKDKGLYKALRICVFLMIFQQLSGVLAVVSYTQSIFEMSGSTIPAETSAILVGVVSLIAVIISSQLIDTRGRKILLTISCTLAWMALFSLGIYFCLQDNKFDLSKVFWIPIVSVMVFMFAFNFGLAILPWVILGEVFPSSVKAAASTIASMSNFCLSFLVTMCFTYLVELITIAGTFFIFGTIMVLGTIFCIVVLPETKGKTFQEIETILNR